MLANVLLYVILPVAVLTLLLLTGMALFAYVLAKDYCSRHPKASLVKAFSYYFKEL